MKNITAGAMNLRLAAIRLLNSSVAATRSQSADRIASFDRSFSFNPLSVDIVSPSFTTSGTVRGAVATWSHHKPGRYSSLYRTGHRTLYEEKAGVLRTAGVIIWQGAPLRQNLLPIHFESPTLTAL
jgi:hypothetical protein